MRNSHPILYLLHTRPVLITGLALLCWAPIVLAFMGLVAAVPEGVL